ncbi:MAG: SusD/RagB family nutrient-binding outer membrane lipoprotein, partial [Chitinophagaceae bacterium]
MLKPIKTKGMKKLVYIFCSLLLLVAVGCQKALDINQNPNRPTQASMEPSLMLARTLNATATRVAVGYPFAARWIGYWTRSGTYGASSEEESYNITTSFQAGQWSGWYGILFDLDVIEKMAIKRDQKIYTAIAKIMKTIGFMNLVDQYNNVPYSKAFQLSENLLPAYDKGADIYNDMLAQLDQAVTLLNGALPGDNPGIEQADIVFQGNTTMWRRLANTQRLRLVMHLSQINGFDFAGQMAKITADGSGLIGSGQTASTQPGYLVDNGKQNPFWNAHELLYNGAEADNYDRANNFSLNLMKNNDDIRYEYYFDEAVQPLNGNVYFGYDYGFVDPNPNNPKAANSSAVGGPGLAKSPTQAQWFFTSVESMFLQAEAIQRGWLPGDAKTAYEQAVRESFIWLGVGGSAAQATAAANTYLASGNAVVDWNQAATPDAKIRLIGTQKY